MAGAASPKLQLLADALALEFSQSLASEQCAGALRRLLPGLEYLSIAVTNPAQAGCIVASAPQGPTTLHLHDASSSMIGTVLASSQPAQLCLADVADGKAALSWTDVQQMAAQAPGAAHLLCIPFGAGGSRTAADDASEAALRCQQHVPSGSGTGALLFGLAAAPSLDTRRAALLALLARCLPAPMARLSGDTLAFVNFACGNNVQCSCCCADDDEGEEAAGSGDGSGGDGRMPDGPDHDRSGPSQALLIPQPAEAGRSSAQGRSAGPSDCWTDEDGKTGGPGPSKAAAAAAAPLGQTGPPRRGVPTAADRHTISFSKALLAAAGEDGDITAQRPLTLTFQSALVEREYGQWIARYHLKHGDMMTSLLLVTALIMVAFHRPHHLMEHAPGSLALSLGMALPLTMSWLNRTTYMPLRIWLVGAFRLYAVSFINIVCIHSHQTYLAPDRAQQWVTFWRLTGAESLCVTALGFRMPLRLSLPLQLAALAIVAWNLPQMCSECFPGVSMPSCFRSSATTALVFGCVLPTFGLRHIEQRSRAAFAGQLRASAVHSQ